MTLTPSELEVLVRATLVTRPEEIGCDACLERVARYAETRLAGLPTPEALRLVEEHLSICGECQEEFAALAAALRNDGSEAPTDPKG
jgi:predicted anti-sigma-YlaC factor YlaD